MRVIGGELRGRRLTAPVGTTVRPTSDRVREAIFDMLFSLGAPEGMRVADLFAGSGALGIEALSRGASSVVFVEHDGRSVATIRHNLLSVGLGDVEHAGVVSVVRKDVEAWTTTTNSHFDLAFCDPPYAFAGWNDLVPHIPADLMVLESSSEPSVPAGWAVIRSRRYGGTLVTMARPDRETVKGAS